jgi:hypothetical protein
MRLDDLVEVILMIIEKKFLEVTPLLFLLEQSGLFIKISRLHEVINVLMFVNIHITV